MEKVSNEHDIKQIKTVLRRATTEDTPVNLNDIFKPSPGQEKPIRTVLTKRVADNGINNLKKKSIKIYNGRRSIINV